MKLLGIFYFEGYADPSAAIIEDGKVVAFAEEERLVRNKHAIAYFPIRAVQFVLDKAGLSIGDVDAITVGWDCEAHDDGQLASHFDSINKTYEPSPQDQAWQQGRIHSLGATRYKQIIHKHLRKLYGDVALPPVKFVRHHLAHAVMAHFHSGYDESLILSVDGSGEWTTTSWWRGKGDQLELLNEVCVPHSLGWFYSAFTEYLGFAAYDGEYKVMGLAAYGEPDPEIADKLKSIIWYDGHGGFESDPYLISMGDRSFSSYFPDQLVDHIGRAPRAEAEEISPWHINFAYEVQQRLESIVQEMTRYWVDRTGIKNLVMTGGVGLNVKMNGNLLDSGLIDDIFVHPLCSDTGMSIGSAMTYEYQQGNLKPARIEHVSFGPSYEDSEIERILTACKLEYSREESIEKSVARLLADGKIVGWFQGAMEAGPRALGNRSILADPRVVDSRDRVNAVVKFREFWRPFCPSMTAEGAKKYLERFTHAPFMIVTFRANDAAQQEVPAVVHTDGTSRVQVVDQRVNPRYHGLLEQFEKLTDAPVLLNTSFNIKGEPIVCTPHDAIRTFAATGLDALAIGPFLLCKPDAKIAEAICP